MEQDNTSNNRITADDGTGTLNQPLELEETDALIKIAHYLIVECNERGLRHSRILAGALVSTIQQELQDGVKT